MNSKTFIVCVLISLIIWLGAFFGAIFYLETSDPVHSNNLQKDYWFGDTGTNYPIEGNITLISDTDVTNSFKAFGHAHLIVLHDKDNDVVCWIVASSDGYSISCLPAHEIEKYKD